MQKEGAKLANKEHPTQKLALEWHYRAQWKAYVSSVTAF